MPFIQHFYFATYALVMLGIFALYISEFLAPHFFLWPLIAIWLRHNEASANWLKSFPEKVVSILSIIVFAACFYYYFITLEDLIAATIYFTIYIQLVRILTGKGNRDFFQMYIVSFSHLIIATLLTIDVLYIVPFLLFIILAPWCFTLFNLKNQLELAYFPKDPKTKKIAENKASERVVKKVKSMLRSRDVVSGRFFIIIASLSVFLLVGTMSVFFLFPRVSFGFLFKKAKRASSVSGFSENVDLSTFGTIKQDSRVVMRIETDRGKIDDLDEIYWRGMTYDDYDGKAWKRTLTKAQKKYASFDTRTVTLHKHDPETAFRQKILLDQLTTQIIFAADEILAVGWQPSRLENAVRKEFSLAEDAYGSLYFSSNLKNDRAYVVYSNLTRPTAEELRAATYAFYEGEYLDSESHNRYLRLPEFSDRFYKLAESIGKNMENPYDKVAAVKNYLITQLSYTLDVPPPGKQPIETFLFDNKRGHCEYFASTAVLLIRALGVPARLVSGFRGGSWNTYGEFIAVRQSDAHTWVEVFMGNYGWQRIDPTPPDRTALDFEEIRFVKFREFFEFLETRWYRYIVDYDLSMQTDAALSTFRKARSSFESLKSLTESGNFIQQFLSIFQRDRVAGSAAVSKQVVKIVLAVLLLVALIYFLISFLLNTKKRRQHRLYNRQLEFFQTYIDLAKKRGVHFASYQTPREFNQQVEKHWSASKETATWIDAHYYELRYGGKVLNHSDERHIKDLIEKLRQSSN